MHVNKKRMPFAIIMDTDRTEGKASAIPRPGLLDVLWAKRPSTVIM